MRTPTAVRPAAASHAEQGELDRARRAFADALIDAGLLVPASAAGLYGRTGTFEDVVEGIGRVLRAAGPAGVPRYRFPPVLALADFDRTDYLASFPHLAGAVHTFRGDDRDHAAMLGARAAGQPWDSWLTPASTALVSAACHPAYPMLTGQLPTDGALLDVQGYCFRHEPAVDPARMQAFRQHEFVRVGSPDQAAQHRDDWVQRGGQVLDDLGLSWNAVAANDPFFGRAGRLLAAGQERGNLKTELVVRLYGDLDDGTAVVSCNCHRDHFGRAFDIRTPDGQPAHSACVGFGLERLALAMVRTHGFDPGRWPARIRERMR